MNRLPKLYYVLVLVLLIASLTGCELRRTEGEASDLEPVSEAPTLVPLGADSAELTGEATPIPTVINVQPDAADAQLAETEAAPVVPEVEAPAEVAEAAVPEEPVAVNGEAEEAAVTAETFSPPEQAPETTDEEPIIVDAPTGDLPDGGPVAADPPAALADNSGTAAGYGVNGPTYIVRPGDTLFSIGLNYGLSALALMEANGLTSETIYVGQELVIPIDGAAGGYAPSPGNYAPPVDGPVSFHVVSAGETLYAIAMQYGLSVDAIAAANGIPYPYIIKIGQELIIPRQGSYYGQPPMPQNGYFPPMPENNNGYYAPQYPQEQVPQYQYPQGSDNNYYPAPNYGNAMPGGATHVVAPGETLYMIAQRYGLSAAALAAANGLSNPDQIYVGQVLFLP